MNKEKIIEVIEDLKLNNEDFTILSTSALVFRGILEIANDVDIAVSNKGLEELKKRFNLKPKDEKWYIVNENVDCVVDAMENKREKIDNYYLQDIDNYLSFIINSEREKDKKRVDLVKKYMKER